MTCGSVIPGSESVSCSDHSALDLYERALVQMQTYVGDPIGTIDQALARAPDFVLGHAFRALALLTTGERRFAEMARVSVATAETLLARAHPRERALVAAARLLVDGDWARAQAVLDRSLVDHPRDILAIQIAHLFDFFRGDALNLRNRIARVLPHWGEDVPGYSYLLGMYAFGLEECNQYAEAEDTARRALALEPRDAWAVHAGAHVMEMQGRIDEGIAWLSSREAHWAPDNGFAYHNWWHLALFHLDQSRPAEALKIYDERIHPAPPETVLQLIDSTGMLWRLWLEGVELGERAARVADNWAARLDTERGFYAFNDMHAMMAFAMTGREAEAQQLETGIAWALEHGARTNRAMTRDVGQPVCRALRAFGQGRYGDAIAGLEPVRDIAMRFGGSHAQRDALSLTLIESALRSAQPALARHYLAERIVLKPGSRWARRLGARAAAGAAAH
jgi:tetratricopeptide (TPR) repeat protein